ncbi:hypothetical protein C2G38_150720 [Gigaspora rosea]|uniref:Uncharacterized protein n=1 Tax=Gigaspora rosea TaxID=44941 RepID=A0A397W8V4_9GLOM|nr:hypothetical protein C2G38_150720 [Gigaspora rosea]
MLTDYKLQGGQLGYRRNVINFVQDIQEFITKLPRNPSTIDTLIIRKPGHHFKSIKNYNLLLQYRTVKVDGDILHNLPKDDSIFD